MSNTIAIEAGDITFQLTFKAIDAYTITPLGCHAGTLGNFTSNYIHKAHSFLEYDAILNLMAEHDVYRKIMDRLVATAKAAFGGWSSGGTTYTNKGHWIISSPWTFRPEDGATKNWTLGTADIMDLIHQFCTYEPETYGHSTLTPATDCGAHSNNSGGPVTRTLIWHPPHIAVRNTGTKTFCSGVYAPRRKPIKGKETKAVPEPKPKAASPNVTVSLQPVAPVLVRDDPVQQIADRIDKDLIAIAAWAAPPAKAADAKLLLEASRALKVREAALIADVMAGVGREAAALNELVAQDHGLPVEALRVAGN